MNYPALEAFIAKGSIADISTADPSVIKEVQSILCCTIDGVAGTQTVDAFSQWKASTNQNQPTLLGSSSARLLLEYAAKPKGETCLKLTKTEDNDEFGLRVLVLDYFKNGFHQDSVECCSGQPYAQVFEKGEDSPSGSYRPLPQGTWGIGDISWSNGKDNFSGTPFSGGLGFAVVPLTYMEPGTTERGDILIHCDYNRDSCPGTAGCVGLLDDDGLRRVIGWLRESDVKTLKVDWGLS